MPQEPGTGRTRRQELAEALADREWTFDGLRQAFQLSVRELEDDLRHVERSARRGPDRLRVTPARCEDCGFTFRNREPRHFHPPSRCPECKTERILPARLRIGTG